MESILQVTESQNPNFNKKRTLSQTEMKNDYEDETVLKKRKYSINKEIEIEESSSQMSDNNIKKNKSLNDNDANSNLMYELSDEEEEEDDINNGFTINDYKKKYHKSHYMTVDEYLKTPVKQSNKIKPYMIVKLIYKHASSKNLAPHKCIFEDKTNKIEVYIWKNIPIKMENLRLNKWYFLTDIYGKEQLEHNAKYFKLPQLVIIQFKPTSCLHEIILTENDSQYELSQETINQGSIVNRDGNMLQTQRSIKYYTQHRNKPVECKIIYDPKKKKLCYKNQKNISGRLLSVESKKTSDDSTYFRCELTDGTDNIKINIFNVFDHDITAFEKLKSEKGIIGCYNFNMKIKDDLKIFSLGTQGYYKFNVINPINSFNILSEINIENTKNVMAQTNSSLSNVKRILNNKTTQNSEWYIVEAKIDQITYPFTNIPFKFWLKNYSVYGSYNIEEGSIVNDKNNLNKSVEDEDVQVKFNIAVDLSDETIFKNLNLGKKAVQQLHSSIKNVDIKQAFYLWTENSSEFENTLDKNVDQWFKFKINIFYFQNQYRIMIKDIELMK